MINKKDEKRLDELLDEYSKICLSNNPVSSIEILKDIRKELREIANRTPWKNLNNV